jgi:hypothetical protein
MRRTLTAGWPLAAALVLLLSATPAHAKKAPAPPPPVPAAELRATELIA